MQGPLWSLLCFCLITTINSTQLLFDDFLLQERLKETALLGQEVVVLVGRPDVGIDSISKFIRHDQWSEVIEYDTGTIKKEDYNRSQNNPFFESLNSNIDEKSGLVIVEYPCQVDRSPELDLVFSVQIKNILDTANRAKIIMIEEYKYLQQNDTIHGLLACATNLIKSNIDSFGQAIGLLVTEINEPDKSSTELLNVIKENVAKTREYLIEERSKGNLEMTNNLEIHVTDVVIGGRYIGIMRQPEELGSSRHLISLKLNYAFARELIFTMVNLSTSFKEDFSVNVAPKTVEYIKKNLLPTPRENITTQFRYFSEILRSAFLSNPFPRQYNYASEYYSKIIRQLKIVTRMEDFEYYVSTAHVDQAMWQNIMVQTSYLRILYSLMGKNHTEFDSEASNMFGSKTRLLEELDEHFSFNEFCSKFVSDFDTYPVRKIDASESRLLLDVRVQNFDNWKALLTKFGFSEDTTHLANRFKVDEKKTEAIHDIVEVHYVGRTYTNVDLGLIKIKGEYLCLSHYANQLEANGTITEIVLIATKKIFIDSNLLLVNKHLTLISPVIEVVGNGREIKMKGENGLDSIDDCMPDQSLKIGEKWRNGYSSGDFIMVALNILNRDLHVLSSAGGAGGKGGNSNYVYVSSAKNSQPETESNHLCKRCDYSSLMIRNTLNTWQKEERIPITAYQCYRYGGKGGAGLVKLIINNERSLKRVRINHGNYGEGGWGLNSAPIFVPSLEYECYPGNKSLAYNYHCSTQVDSRELDKVNIETDNSDTLLYKNKTGSYEMTEFIKDYLLSIFEIQKAIFESPESIQFLRFLINSTQPISCNDRIQHYSELLELLKSKEYHTQDELLKLGAIYLEIYSVYRESMVNCKHELLEQLNLQFVSRLNYLEVFTSQKHVKNLHFVAKDFRNKLTENLSENPLVNNIEVDLKEMRMQIKNAENSIAMVHKELSAQTNENINGNVYELLEKTKEVQYGESRLAFRNHYKLLQKAMVAKTRLGTVEVFASVAGAFFHPAAIAGQVMAIGMFFTKTEDVDLAEITSNAFKGVDEAKSVIAEYKEQRWRDDDFRFIGQWKALAKGLTEIGGIDIDTIIFEEWETIQAIVYFCEPGADLISISEISRNLTGDISRFYRRCIFRFDYIDDILEKTVHELNDTRWEEAKRRLKIAKNVYDSGRGAVEVLRTVQEDEAHLDMVENAIKSKKLYIHDMLHYEIVLNNQFVPLLEEMLDKLKGMQSDLKDADSVMLILRKMDLKKHARSFAALIKQFTQNFDAEEDEIYRVLVQLEKYMILLIDSYDKIDQLQYRVQLRNFISYNTEAECDQNHMNCSSNQKLVMEIRADEVKRRYFIIFNAIQQFLFPFGRDIVEKYDYFYSMPQAINSSINSTDEGYNFDSFIELNVNNIKDHLDAIIPKLNQRHKTCTRCPQVLYANFTPENRPYSHPFFTWPNAKYFNDIRKLLRGEKITLSASVYGFSNSVLNAVKFTSLLLKMTSADPVVEKVVQKLLENFRIHMVHSGESHYRCGENHYVIGGDSHDLYACYEKSVSGTSTCQNIASDKLAHGVGYLSPYTIWDFQLVHDSSVDEQQLLNELQAYAHLVDLELVGTGSFLSSFKEAEICNSNLDKYYQYFNQGLYRNYGYSTVSQYVILLESREY